MSTEPNGEQTPEEPRRGYAKTAGRGLSWTAMATLVLKVMLLGSHIVLGYLLSEDDFGLYGMAIGFAALVKGFQDGGVNHLLIKEGADAFRRLAGPCLWISGSINFVLAGALAAGSVPLAHALGEPKLAPLMVVVALALVFGTVRSVMMARLLIGLRYDLHAKIHLCTGFIQYSLMVVFALMGMGAMSLLLPLAIAALFESVVSWIIVRRWFQMTGPRLWMWPGLLRQVWWLLLGAMAVKLSIHGDFLVAGLFLPAAVLGLYVFAFRMVGQVSALLLGNLRNVLMPIMSRLKEEPERQGAALARVCRTMMLISSVGVLAFAIVIGDIEAAIWGGQWAAAVPAMQIIAAVFPLRSLLGIVNSVQLAQGSYRAYFVYVLIQAVGVMVGVAVMALTVGTATSLAVGMALGTLAVCPALTILQLRQRAQTWGTVAGALVPYPIAVGMALVVWALHRAVPMATPTGLLTIDALLWAGLWSVFYGLLMGLTFRLGLSAAVRDAIRIAPGRAETVAVRLLRYRQ